MTDKLHTIQECRNLIFDRIGTLYAEDEVRAMTRLILEDLTNKSNASLLADPLYDVSSLLWDKINQICDYLKQYKPLQYIMGESEFMGRRFRVNPSVLIPRPETEELVDLVIRENRAERVSLIDIGTGSGVIAVTVALEMKRPTVTATDISQSSLDTAAFNARENGAVISFTRSDILNPSTDKNPPTGKEKYDIIVSNPPYVRESEKKRMGDNVLKYEPHNALFVPDNDPLIFYRAIFRFAEDHLLPGGKIYLEINEALGQEMISLARKQGYREIRLIKDINGKERIVAVTR